MQSSGAMVAATGGGVDAGGVSVAAASGGQRRRRRPPDLWAVSAGEGVEDAQVKVMAAEAIRAVGDGGRRGR